MLKLVIEIPENEYGLIKEIYEKNDIVESTYSYIYHGTPLPKGHGELKDTNVLRQKLMIWDYKVNAIPNYAWKCIEDTPTIIEADKEIKV